MPEAKEQDGLRAAYAAMADGELLQLASANEELTDAAQAALAAELAHRQLTAPEAAATAYDEVEERPLVTVAHSLDMMSAQMAKSMLESAGIPCSLKNENTSRIAWPVVTGGIDIQVDAVNESAAREFLEQPPEALALKDEGDDPDPPADA